MGAPTIEHGAARRAHGPGPERTCAVSRERLPPEALIRFVRGPDEAVVPDLACRLPGRGVWVACHRERIAEAARRNVFARSLKRQVRVPADLPDLVERLLRQRLIGALGLANKAGLVVTGFTKVENAIDAGAAEALLHAAEAAEDGRAKLDRKLRAMLGAGGGTDQGEIVAELTSQELSLALGRSHVVHAALAKGGAARNFLKEAARLRRYRSLPKGGAARPPASRSDTEQA